MSLNCIFNFSSFSLCSEQLFLCIMKMTTKHDYLERLLHFSFSLSIKFNVIYIKKMCDFVPLVIEGSEVISSDLPERNDINEMGRICLRKST